MKKKVCQIVIITLLIMSLMLVDIITLAMGIASFAVSSNKNIEFSTIFKIGEEEKNEVEKSIYSNDIRIKIEIEVKNEGCLDGVIEFANKNFKFKQEDIEGVNSITDNTISLNQINAGGKLTFDVGIEPNFGDVIDLASLDMDNKITLKGKYKVSEGREDEVNMTKTLKLTSTSPYTEEDEGSFLETQIISNKIYQINEENKRIVQVLVNSQPEGAGYPIKETTIELEAPEGIEKVDIQQRENRTSNKDGIESTQNENKLQIKIQNPENDGKISYKKQGQDSIIVSLVYPEEKDIQGQDIYVKSNIELYDINQTVLTKESTQKIEEEKDGMIGYYIENEQDIYKGKMYAKEEQEYESTTKIDIRYPEIENQIQIQEGKSDYDIVYKKSYINKEELLKVLGNTGWLIISGPDGRTIKSINKWNIDNENKNEENIVITYDEDFNEILIELKGAENAGIIEIKHEKAIRTENKQKEEIKETASINIEGKLLGTSNINERDITSSINLKEPETKADIQISNPVLSADGNNENVEIRTTLIANDNSYDLYKNPTLEIECPEPIKDININSVNLLYGEGLAVENYGVDKNKIIINLSGEQTKHYDSERQKGATVVVGCNLNIDAIQESKTENIMLKYTNENATQYENEGIAQTEVNYIMSANILQTEKEPIQQLSNSIITLQKEGKDIYEGQVQKFTLTVKNNTNEDISNITVKDQLPEELIYCTPIRNEGYNNTYKEEETNEYNETIEELKANSTTKLEYYVRAKKGEQGKKVGSKAQATIENNETIFESNLFESTIHESKFQLDMQLANNADVHYDDTFELEYVIKVKNISGEQQTGVKISNVIPDEMEYVSSQFLTYDEETDGYSEDFDNVRENNDYNADTRTVTWNVGTLENGEKAGVKLRIKLNKYKGDEVERIISNFATVKADGTEEYPSCTEEIKQYSSPKCTLEVSTNLENQYVYEGDEFEYHVKITNNSLNDLTTAKLVDSIPIGLQGIRVKYFSEEDEEKTITIDKELELGINVNANSVFTATIVVEAEELPDDMNELLVNNTISLQADNIDDITSEPIETIIKKRDAEGENGEAKHSISGYVWLDENQNGQRDDNESNLTGIDIKLYTEEGDNLANTTPTNGKYEFNNLEPGIYAVEFNYNTAQYSITEYQKTGVAADRNSDAIRTSKEKDGKTITVGLTKTITISDSDITNIDMGLVKLSDLDPEKGDPNDPNPGPDDPNYSGSEIRYSISGCVWLDENQNGQRDDGEGNLSNIAIKLYKENGDNVGTLTQSNGKYEFGNLDFGRYIVAFAYDTTQYRLTEYQKAGVATDRNSDAIKSDIEEEGKTITVGLTDIITISNNDVTNIDMGLIKNKKFDLKLDKTINKIIVRNSNSEKVYQYDNANLAKIEIDRKTINATDITIEYKINITNEGEIEGYAKKIIDYMPQELDFDAAQNKNWYENNGNLESTILANDIIKPGETKTLDLVLTKKLTEGKVGTFMNTAEILEDYNEMLIKDEDSTPGNKKANEDDMSTVSSIISIKTGKAFVYITLILVSILVLGLGIYFINKKVLIKND